MTHKDCAHKATCEMYRLLQLSGTRETWQARYCDADWARCARYEKASQGRPVPINLMPNGQYLNVLAKEPGA